MRRNQINQSPGDKKHDPQSKKKIVPMIVQELNDSDMENELDNIDNHMYEERRKPEIERTVTLGFEQDLAERDNSLIGDFADRFFPVVRQGPENLLPS